MKFQDLEARLFSIFDADATADRFICFQKMMALYVAAEDVLKHTGFDEKADQCWRNNLQWSLEDLQKSDGCSVEK